MRISTVSIACSFMAASKPSASSGRTREVLCTTIRAPCGQLRGIAQHTPRNSSGLVVESSMKVPGARRFVLKRRVRLLLALLFLLSLRASIGLRPHHLDRHRQTHSLGLEKIVKINRRGLISVAGF